MLGLPLWIIYAAIAVSVIALAKKYFNGGTCKLSADLTGKVVIVTGANCGCGYYTAVGLAKLGARIVMACRDAQKAQKAIEELKEEVPNAKVEFMKLDLGDIKTIKEFVDAFKSAYDRLDILVNNAGLLLEARYLTHDGFETCFGVNHLGHFMLTLLLRDYLLKTPKSRVINVSSEEGLRAHMKWDDLMMEKGWTSFGALGQSKLANIIFSQEFNRRYESKGIKSVSLHPGVLRSEGLRYIKRRTLAKIALFIIHPILLLIFKSSRQGAQTTLYCSLLDFDKLQGGEYYADCEVGKISPEATSEENGKKLWKVSLDLLNMKDE